MKNFDYYQPTRIMFGCGRITEIGDIASKFGESCLLVTTSAKQEEMIPLYNKVKSMLEKSQVKYAHFDGVLPNPTTRVVSDGALKAKEIGAQVIIGVGGGSSMDTAKAIAVEVAHNESAWEYLFFKKEPTDKTLPIIVVPTTSGTGSQVTPCAVVTKTEDKCKSALWHENIIPKVAVIDPEVIVTLPKRMTALTGFDAFAHSFESLVSTGSNAYVEMTAMGALEKIITYLPRAIDNGEDIEAREQMAWADTIAGLSFASGGVTLPHGIGMQIGGHCPSVAHGEGLAAFYPAFTRYTYKSSISKFAAVGRLFDKKLASASNEKAALMCCKLIDDFLKRIGLWINLKDLGVPEEEMALIADDGMVLPDYLNNPRVATRDEMYELLVQSFEKQ